jgi:hypothetical protein
VAINFHGIIFLVFVIKLFTMKNKNEEPHKNQNKQDEKILHSSQTTKKEKTQQKNFRFPRYPVLGQKAEDYLREEANIEDMPNEKDQENYDKVIAQTKKERNEK